MNDALILLLAAAAGAALGAFFFGGLWWTVQKITSSSRAPLWFFASFILRMGVTIGGFYLVGGDQWQRIIACLVGFLLARALVTRLTGKGPRLAPEVTHAP